MKRSASVKISRVQISLPTYLPAAPDKNPMFLEKRVYQGSSGKVYPLPFTDRIAEKPVIRKWKALRIENEYLRALVLPELGGRIHALQDKTNGYDLIYNQHVIKPALVGLAGPWASGGIEFNWPQHHRPATFLPVNIEIEEDADGSKTIWCSDHDPMSRMKGMHGVCLHPDKAYLELKVRAYNRTPFTQTFLWWANVATRVHEAYQSFFPPDVNYVADHARRSMSEFPLAQGQYYGVNYGNRSMKGIPAGKVPSQFVPPHSSKQCRKPSPCTPIYAPNDLSWYANIPVPTSYMCMGSKGDFFGGYDHKCQAGIVHIASHHISPGKKQWTWGNHDFGYAWDRNLTDRNANGEFPPYIEIMAGVYTDNQPDFSFLQPGETKTWSQYWYPIQKIGPAQHANVDAALSLRVLDHTNFFALSANDSALPHGKTLRASARFGVSITKKTSGASIDLLAKGKKIFSIIRDLDPGHPFVKQIKIPGRITETDLQLRVSDQEGSEIISFQPKARMKSEVPPPAMEPAPPAEIASADELFITGLHLEQYRHATRCPTLYWREALHRDPLDTRCNNALGLWHLRRGEFVIAEKHFRQSIQRQTRRNANPNDGEPSYNLGLTLRHLERDSEAYDAFYKACWNQGWVAAGYHALAEIDCCRGDWATALDHLNRSLRFNMDNLRARNLKVIVLRKLGRDREAKLLLGETLALDPLDWWARHLSGAKLTCDTQAALDLAHDHARAGLYSEGISVLCSAVARTAKNATPALKSGAKAMPTQDLGTEPMVQYSIGWLLMKSGDSKAAEASFRRAMALPPDYCFPSRLEEIDILEAAMRANPRDAKAPYYLGNLLYDRRRHDEAIRLWERSAMLDRTYSVVWRNLGIGYFNIRHQPMKARAAYDRAFGANSGDARLLFERDQLWKRLREKPDKRLRELEKYPCLVQQRDDLSLELCALYNQTGQHDKALALVKARNFQPWEGGEGGPLGQWVRSNMALGRAALKLANSQPLSSQSGNSFSSFGNRDPVVEKFLIRAKIHFEDALSTPHNLGESRHLLANQSDIHYWLGCVLAMLGDNICAKNHWRAAASFKGDFQEMSVRSFSEMTYFSALSWEKLGQPTKAKKLFRELLAYAQQFQRAQAKIDYFATSLPTMLLFDDDLQFRQETAAIFLQAQARLGMGQKEMARKLFQHVLAREPGHACASDFLEELHE